MDPGPPAAKVFVLNTTSISEHGQDDNRESISARASEHNQVINPNLKVECSTLELETIDEPIVQVPHLG